MTGEQDMRSPMSQSEDYYAALKIPGIPAKLIRFNDQYHGTGTRPSNHMRYQKFTLDGRVPTVP